MMPYPIVAVDIDQGIPSMKYYIPSIQTTQGLEQFFWSSWITGLLAMPPAPQETQH